MNWPFGSKFFGVAVTMSHTESHAPTSMKSPSVGSLPCSRHAGLPAITAVRVFVCRKRSDMRKSFTGLCASVIDVVDHDPQSDHLFLFFNSCCTMMKATSYLAVSATISETGGMRNRWSILELLCALASLLLPATASANPSSGAENRVWVFCSWSRITSGLRVP